MKRIIFLMVFIIPQIMGCASDRVLASKNYAVVLPAISVDVENYNTYAIELRRKLHQGLVEKGYCSFSIEQLDNALGKPENLPSQTDGGIVLPAIDTSNLKEADSLFLIILSKEFNQVAVNLHELLRNPAVNTQTHSLWSNTIPLPTSLTIEQAVLDAKKLLAPLPSK